MPNKKDKGSTYIEVLIALTFLLIVLNPLLSSLIYVKKGFNNIDKLLELENEMEKVRAFYKINSTIYIPDDEEFKINITERIIFENIKSLDITIEKNELKRESNLYVY